MVSLRINTVGGFGPRIAVITKEQYMIEYDLDKEHSILHVEPKSSLEQDDFVKLAQVVDPTSSQPAVLPASSSKPRSSPDGTALGRWLPTFASCASTTSGSRESPS